MPPRSFTRNHLACSQFHEEVNEEQGVREAMLAVGESGSCIQLLAPLSDDSPIGKFLARSGEGIQQMAYTVSDMDALCAHLRDVGCSRPLRHSQARHSQQSCQLRPPEGCRWGPIELVEPATT